MTNDSFCLKLDTPADCPQRGGRDLNKRKKPGDWSLGGNIGFFIGVIVAFNIFWPAGIW